jgi:hypothetical protein
VPPNRGELKSTTIEPAYLSGCYPDYL